MPLVLHAQQTFLFWDKVLHLRAPSPIPTARGVTWPDLSHLLTLSPPSQSLTGSAHGPVSGLGELGVLCLLIPSAL